jgi:GntR family transcriptional regulator, gluconate operon transcriptional repressor
MISKYNKNNVTKNVIEKLRGDIILRKYSPEDRLLEVSLAEKYNVSRGSIRVAIQQLVYEGLIEEKRGEKRAILFTSKIVKNMYDLRKFLELKAVQVLIKSDSVRYSPLVQILSDLENREGNTDISNYYEESDIDFHRKLIQASNNRAILQAWETMSSVFITLLRVHNLKYKSDYIDRFFERHKKILDLIILQDNACLKTIAQHIEEGKQDTLDVISSA